MSTIKADTIVASDGTSAVTLTKQSAAKAWADYDGSANSILASFNIASVSDNATGDFTYAWTTPFSSAYYSPVGTAGSGRAAGNTLLFIAPTDGVFTSSEVRTGAVDAGGTLRDVGDNLLQVHGDLA